MQVLYRFQNEYFVKQNNQPSQEELTRLGLSTADLEGLLENMLSQDALKLKERPDHGMCFLGNDLVKWLLVQRVVSNSRDAVVALITFITLITHSR